MFNCQCNSEEVPKSLIGYKLILWIVLTGDCIHLDDDVLHIQL